MRNQQQTNNEYQALDERSVHELITLINEEDKTVAYTIEKTLPDIEKAITKIVEVMKNGGRLFYIGAGTSGRLGILDASECPPTFGVSPDLVQGIIAGGDTAIKIAVEGAEDDFEAGQEAVIELVTKNDVVVGIAASGSTPYVLGGLKAANTIGALTIGLSCNANTRISAVAKLAIEVPVGPEIVDGSTRLKAGTAQKLVLNMITTITMIKLGKVYNNLMVNVQATNKKLRQRVVDIIIKVTGVDEDIAQDIATRSKGDARVGILMFLFQVSYKEALQALEANNQHFRDAVNVLSGK